MGRSAALSCLLVAGSLEATGAPAPRPTRGVEGVVVERRILPVTLDPRGPRETCSALGADDLAVFEDGQPVARVESLDRGKAPTVHAILIDTSLSMSGFRLGAASAAARSYLERLPPADEALVATIDSRFLLRSGFTNDRSRWLEAIEGLKADSITLLWDGIRSAIDELAGRHEWRRVLIVVTDAEDMYGEDLSWLEPGFVPTEALIRGAARTEGLRTFVLRIVEPGARRRVDALGSGPTIDVALRRLADETGGALLEVDDPDALGARLEEIRDRLEREVFLSYAPRPFGECRGDRKGYRKIDVELRGATLSDRRAKAAGCDVTIPVARRAVWPVEAPSPRELAREGDLARRRDPTTGLLPMGEGVELVPPAEWREEYDRRAAEIRKGARRDGVATGATVVRALRESGCEGGPRLQAHASGLRGCVLDVLVGWHRNLKDPWEPAGPSGFPRRPDARPLFGLRSFEIAIAPPGELPGSLEQAVIRWMLGAESPPVPTAADPFARSPAIVDGRTWLTMRRSVARALVDRYGPYRRFAIEVRRAGIGWRLDREVERLRENGPGLTELEIEGLRTAKREELEIAAEHPSDAEIERTLAAWLGDVPADDLADGIERWAANLLVAAEGHGPVEAVDRIEARWGDFAAWFPLPTRAGVLTPLAPVLAGDRIGFYRVVLPRDGAAAVWGLGEPPPRLALPDDDLIAPRPLGSWLVRRILDGRAGPPGLLDAPRLVSGVTTRRTDPAARDVYRVAVTFESIDPGEVVPLEAVTVEAEVHVPEGGPIHLMGDGCEEGAPESAHLELDDHR